MPLDHFPYLQLDTNFFTTISKTFQRNCYVSSNHKNVRLWKFARSYWLESGSKTKKVFCQQMLLLGIIFSPFILVFLTNTRYEKSTLCPVMCTVIAIWCHMNLYFIQPQTLYYWRSIDPTGWNWDLRVNRVCTTRFPF